MTLHRYAIGNDSILTERDRADVQKVIDAWVADWRAVASVSLDDQHTIRIVVRGDLTPDQQSRLAKEIEREAARIESERM